MDKDKWEEILNNTPTDWVARQVYADWLRDNNDNNDELLASAQDWMAINHKTPGPACVLEAAWHEASWFVESSIDVDWLMPGYTYCIIRVNWGVPANLYRFLDGYITKGRRDGGRHNLFAKSWMSRSEAELALAKAIAIAIKQGVSIEPTGTRYVGRSRAAPQIGPSAKIATETDGIDSWWDWEY
jgi:hypothetical protein